MSETTKQLVIFSDKLALDKNFAFEALMYEGKQSFKIDIAKTFEEKPEHITDIFNFLKKRYYDSPLIDQPFTIKEFAAFLNVSYKQFLKMNVTPEDDHNRWTNFIERLLYKMLERNIVRRSTYKIPSSPKKHVEVNEKFSLLDRYFKVNTQFPDKVKDKRQNEYVAELASPIKDNLSTFLFYTTIQDYRIVVNEFYRNPNYRFLFLRLSNLLNNLRAGIQDTVGFDELAHILGYTQSNPFHLKDKIDQSIKKILALESLRGLGFRWNSNAKGYAYIPNFYTTPSLQENGLTESRHDKFKRLDMLVLSRLKPYLIQEPLTTKLNYLDVKFKLANLPECYQILESCFQAVMKKNDKDHFKAFCTDFVYKDDYDNAYASNLVKHVYIDNKPLYQEDARYLHKKVTLL
jgi:hypothetical protein